MIVYQKSGKFCFLDFVFDAFLGFQCCDFLIIRKYYVSCFYFFDGFDVEQSITSVVFGYWFSNFDHAVRSVLKTNRRIFGYVQGFFD